MKIGLYDPYLDTLGGGEKVFLTILEEAIKLRGSEVVLFAKRRPDPKAWKRLNISVKPSQFIWKRATDATIPNQTEGLDLFVTIRGDVPPESRAARSVAIIQFPFEYLPFKRKRDFLHPVESAKRRREQKRCLASYDSFAVWTDFVKRHVERRFHVSAVSVIGAPVDVPKAKPGRKEPIILAVGRFITHGHPKKQDLMIRAFRKLYDELPADSPWTLHLAGGSDNQPETRTYIRQLEEASRGLPVEIHVNTPYRNLVDLYRRASIFWHAAGAGENPEKYPERLEHFGITTVEAMTYGVVPVVIGLGGQTEIVNDGKTGYLWNTEEELVEDTRKLIDDSRRRSTMAKQASRSAKRFSKERFAETVRKTILRF